MKIQVTQEDIDYGWRFRPDRCPVARALRRTCGWVSVGINDIRTKIPYASVKYFTPSRRMKQFIRKFDRGEKVKPQAFIIKEL